MLIIIAVGFIVVVIILACSGFWGHRYWKQTLLKVTGAKHEKVVEEKKKYGEYLIFTPKKKTIEVQEDTPSNDQIVEVYDTVTNPPSIILFAFTTVSVSKAQIYSFRSHRFKRHLESFKFGRINSHPGRHEWKMKYMVENPMEAHEHQNLILFIKEMHIKNLVRIFFHFLSKKMVEVPTDEPIATRTEKAVKDSMKDDRGKKVKKRSSRVRRNNSNNIINVQAKGSTTRQSHGNISGNVTAIMQISTADLQIPPQQRRENPAKDVQ